MEIDRRAIPGESLSSVDAELRQVIARIARDRPGLTVEVEPPFVAEEPLGTSPDAPIVQQMENSTRTIVGRSEIVGVPFGTDASRLSAAGIPSVVFGPGDIDLAHTSDEHVSLDEVARAAEILALVATEKPRS